MTHILWIYNSWRQFIHAPLSNFLIAFNTSLHQYLSLNIESPATNNLRIIRMSFAYTETDGQKFCLHSWRQVEGLLKESWIRINRILKVFKRTKNKKEKFSSLNLNRNHGKRSFWQLSFLFVYFILHEFKQKMHSLNFFLHTYERSYFSKSIHMVKHLHWSWLSKCSDLNIESLPQNWLIGKDREWT